MLRQRSISILSKVAVAFVSLIAVQPSQAQTSSTFEYPSQMCASKNGDRDYCQPLQVKARLYMPANQTTTVVIISHGSQGVDARHKTYAEAANSIGMAALVIDHWGSRGIDNIYTDYKKNWDKGADSPGQAIDAMSAIKALSGRFTKFGYLGESQGGNAVIWADKTYTASLYKRLFHTDAPRFEAAVALYPGCFERYSGDGYLSTPVMIMTGDADNNTPAALCQRYAGWMNEHGGHASFTALPKQHHDFDAPYYVKSTSAQNPSHCASTINGSTRTWDETGERFSMSADGSAQFWKKCFAAANGASMTGGNAGDKRTGFREWMAFFQANLR